MAWPKIGVYFVEKPQKALLWEEDIMCEQVLLTACCSIQKVRVSKSLRTLWIHKTGLAAAAAAAACHVDDNGTSKHFPGTAQMCASQALLNIEVIVYCHQLGRYKNRGRTHRQIESSLEDDLLPFNLVCHWGLSNIERFQHAQILFSLAAAPLA